MSRSVCGNLSRGPNSNSDRDMKYQNPPLVLALLEATISHVTTKSTILSLISVSPFSFYTYNTQLALINH